MRFTHLRHSLLFRALILLLLVSCHEKSRNQMTTQESYLRMIGDSVYDPEVDDPTFKTCNGDDRLVQYYAFGQKPYVGEKRAVENLFFNHYKSDTMESQSGMIRIRFVVNCEGKAGRFRWLSADQNYQPKTFHESISSQLIDLTKSINQWKTFKNNTGQTIEYYQYLIFKLEKGQLKEILP